MLTRPNKIPALQASLYHEMYGTEAAYNKTSRSHMLLTCLGHSCQRGLGQRCGIYEHLSPTHILSQALTTGLPAQLNSA